MFCFHFDVSGLYRHAVGTYSFILLLLSDTSSLHFKPYDLCVKVLNPVSTILMCSPFETLMALEPIMTEYLVPFY